MTLPIDKIENHIHEIPGMVIDATHREVNKCHMFSKYMAHHIAYANVVLQPDGSFELKLTFQDKIGLDFIRAEADEAVRAVARILERTNLRDMKIDDTDGFSSDDLRYRMIEDLPEDLAMDSDS